MRIFKPYLSLPIILAGLGLLVLAACSGADDSSTTSKLANEDALPAFARNAPPKVKESYLFAIANPEELAKYPCYCGCGSMGHTSNLSCYIDEIGEDGAITFDNHAAGCGICVDITQDVMRLKSDGKTSLQVRAYIDAQYSPFGPSTDTPLPVE